MREVEEEVEEEEKVEEGEEEGEEEKINYHTRVVCYATGVY